MFFKACFKECIDYGVLPGIGAMGLLPLLGRQQAMVFHGVCRQWYFRLVGLLRPCHVIGTDKYLYRFRQDKLVGSHWTLIIALGGRPSG
ncbi:hypothetical protein [Neisseria iguanae]|uniref:Uncharacterized protein n=1 Tax=Neisseria iguanae TaxID=90242 RepID=A0A2P7U1T1_9NEIS|nr:hypothetical protein [Neisseria iguanae]PSJ80863.1 hypothetical protein C7N83_03530 [Neisseria iguanae]